MNFDLDQFVEMLASIMPDDAPNMKLPCPDLWQEWKGYKDRNVWLDEAICWHTIQRLYKYLANLDPADQRPVTLNLMTPGGSLDCMFALYDLIKNSPVPINTYNVGSCHSAGFIIFLAGKERKMQKYGTFVAHEGSSVQMGTYRETKAAMAQYEKDVERMCRIIEAETNLEYDYIKSNFSEKSDWYINYDEAVSGGILR